MKIWRCFEKIGSRWVEVTDTLPRGRRVGRFAMRRITNRKLKRELRSCW